MIDDPAHVAARGYALSLAAYDARAAALPDRAAILQPDAPAITCGQLAAVAARVASAIVATASAPNPRVAFLSGNPATLTASLLGALKANAAFVPLHPANPRARLAAIVADTRPALVITDAPNRRLGEMLAGTDIPLLCHESLPSQPEPPQAPAAPDALAWILYTSSSTGTAKGVMQTRANVFAYATQVIDGLALGTADRMLLPSPLTAHAGATLSLAALISGAALAPLDLRRTSIDAMAAIIDAQAITVLFAVPTIFRALARQAARWAMPSVPDLQRVRLLRLSGDTVTRADIDDAWRTFPGLATVSVGLGATETGGICHAYFGRGTRFDGRVPVGVPVAGVGVALVDRGGRPVQEGRPGEIVVTGPHLSPGYWNDPAATAAAFADGPGGRSYRTGDLGRQTPDGGFEHLGRIGQQVKINGQRVEIAEVEAALRRLPGVADAAVRCVGRGAKRSLVAWVVPQPGAELAAAALDAGLAATLPRFMIPVSYTHLPALPTTATGKVKVRALRAARSALPLPQGEPGAPGLEATLCAIWQEVLELSQPAGRDDDFLALGGDSLQATRVLARVESACGTRPSIDTLFEARTPAGLATRMAVDEPPSPVPPVRRR